MSHIDGNKLSSRESLLSERESLMYVSQEIRLQRLILSWQLRGLRAMIREIDQSLVDSAQKSKEAA